MLFKLFNSFCLMAFLLSALLQYNDPDPYMWVTVYLAAATLCLDQLYRKRLGVLVWGLAFVCVAWIGCLLPHIFGPVSIAEILDSISMKTRAIEEAREIGGLSLVLLWALITLLNADRATR